MSKIIPQKPILIILYGYPGSGKTYTARQLNETLLSAHLQADRIRAELFESPQYDKKEDTIINQLMNYMAEEFLNAGVSVVYDINASRIGQRFTLRELAKKSHAENLLIWFQMDTETAYIRNKKRDHRRADDKYSASWDKNSFKELISHMQNPTNLENYLVISGKHSFQTQKNAILNKLREMSVIYSGDTTNHLAMPGMVNLIPQANNGRVDLTRRNIVIR